MNREYESMTRVVLSFDSDHGERKKSYVVRVWRTEDKLTWGNNHDIRLSFFAVFDPSSYIEFDELVFQVAHVLDRLPRISAYEILDEAGDGVIVYPDWK